MLHAVIMAGGSGTRFWPASRNACPKQFLKMGGQRTLIQATVDRIDGLVDPQRTLVVTNQRLIPLVHEQLPQLAQENLIGEPCKRDTAPCVALAAAIALHHDPEAIQVVMPSDHVIQTREDFQKGIRFAESLVEQEPGQIVTFGIRPSYPSSAFGYIHRDSRTSLSGAAPDVQAFPVRQFKEKPSVEVAQTYVDSGEYYWNAGIFVWKAKTIMDAIQEYAGEMLPPIREIAKSIGTPQFNDVLQEQFPLIDGKSIDYAVMEHYQNVAVVEAPFAWDDVGNWTSLARLIPPDKNGNSAAGQHLPIDTRNCIVQCDDQHMIVTVGLDDVIVVQTADATLVADRRQEEAIRQVVKELKDGGWESYL